MVDELDLSYLKEKGWNKGVEEDIASKFSDYHNPIGNELSLKYLIIHSTTTQEASEFSTSGTRRPPYNVFIDNAGKIHYLWFTPDEEKSRNTMHEREYTNSSGEYDLCSINLAFYGSTSNGKVTISDATKKTLQMYMLAFAKYHEELKIIGYQQISYGPGESKPYSPGFFVPKMTESIANNLKSDRKNKNLSKLIRNASIWTDSENVMQMKENEPKYIRGDKKYYLYNIKEDKWFEYTGKSAGTR